MKKLIFFAFESPMPYRPKSNFVQTDSGKYSYPNLLLYPAIDYQVRIDGLYH